MTPEQLKEEFHQALYDWGIDDVRDKLLLPAIEDIITRTTAVAELGVDSDEERRDMERKIIVWQAIYELVRSV